MEELSLDKVLALVDTAYAAGEGEIEWDLAISTLLSELDMQACSLSMRSADGVQSCVQHSSPDDMAVYKRDWEDQDICAKAFYRRARAERGHLFETAELVSLSAWRKSDIYNGFFKPRGQDACWALELSGPQDHTASFVITRTAEAGQPTAPARRQLRYIGGHFIRAFRVHALHQRNGKRTASLMDMVERIGRAAVILDRRGRVSFASERALALLGNTARISAGTLTFCRPHHQNVLEKLLSAAINTMTTHAETGAILEDWAGGAPLTIRVVPMRDGHVTDAVLAQEALVMFWTPETLADAEPRLRSLAHFGLTPAETRLARLVGSAIPPAEAADLLGIRVASVRSSLSVIYSKLGIARQSELVALMTRLS